jgi:hypothetical protein
MEEHLTYGEEKWKAWVKELQAQDSVNVLFPQAH